MNPLRVFPGRRNGGFTLLEMMITLAIFIILASAVFGIMTTVLQTTSVLHDNQDRRDLTAALNAFLGKKLREMPAGSTLFSYRRGDGEGLAQNGIIFGTVSMATSFDATVQANGYYTLRLASYTIPGATAVSLDARKLLQQAVSANDPALRWTSLIRDVKTLDWKFEDFNANQWVEIWMGAASPSLVEFTMQIAGDLQPSTMDFWLPRIQPMSGSFTFPTADTNAL